jgi:hypothetical protein
VDRGKVMVNKKEDNSNTIKWIVGIVAVVAIFYMFGVFNPAPAGQTTATITPPGTTPVSPPATTVVVQGVSQPNVPVTGTLNFRLSSSMGTTPAGTSSNLLLLDSSYAVMTGGQFDELATKSNIKKQIADKGVSSLKYYTGTAKIITHSSGIWSDTITGIPGVSTGIAYSYYDVNPAPGENASSAKLFTLNKYNAPTGEWFATLNDGRDRWTLFNYASYNVTDTTATPRDNYTIGDTGTPLMSQTVSWQTNASKQGEGCIDCAIFAMTPDNFTSRFHDLTITARSTTDNGISSVKFTNLPLASSAPDTISITSQVLPTSADSNSHMRFIGYIPANFDTIRTSSDRNQLTWTLTTDTYGARVGINFYIVQNAHALGTTNGAFYTAVVTPVGETGFPIYIGDTTGASGFNVVST